MPLLIEHNDITRMHVDAIVNAANNSLLGGGGVDGCIHRAAGPALLAECRTLGGCETGDAKITEAGNLPCRYVIHTVGPVWKGGNSGEKDLLTSCYRRSLALAKEKGCETLAFPLISSGVYGYPRGAALRVAMETIAEFLETNDMTVYLVLWGSRTEPLTGELYSGIGRYIDDCYRDLPDNAPCPAPSRAPKRKSSGLLELQTLAPDREYLRADSSAFAGSFSSLKAALGMLDESFSEMLLRKIDESGMTDAECYKRANIDRKLFSKIRSNRLYKPGKSTAVAFAIALRLSLDETKELLMKAGYALSHSSKFDIIIEYFIMNGEYDIYVINEALFDYDQCLLGGTH